MSKKVLLFSDIHIHKHQNSSERLENCFGALEWVFQTAIDRKIPDVLFLGDLFHDREKIDSYTYVMTYKLIEKYLSQDKFNLYLLVGNHDMWFHQKNWDVSSVFPLRSINRVTVIDRPCALKIAGTAISFLPYTRDPIGDLKLISNSEKYKILCGHLAVDGAKLNLMYGTTADVSVEHDGEMVKVSTDSFDGYDQVFLGHYHGAQKIGDSAEYIGSPLQLSFGETCEKKHILIYDLDTHEKEYVENKDSPVHLVIRADECSQHKLEGNYVRVIFDEHSASQITEVRNELVNDTKVASFSSEIKKRDHDVHLVMDAKAILDNEEDMFKAYIEQVMDLGDLDPDLLLDVVHKTIRGEYREER